MASGTISKHAIEYTELLATTTISGTGNKALSADINIFDFLIVTLYNTSLANEGKTFFVPPSEYANRIDVSWNATDSTSYYIIMTISFTNAVLGISKFTMAGFTTAKIKVQGAKII